MRSTAALLLVLLASTPGRSAEYGQDAIRLSLRDSARRGSLVWATRHPAPVPPSESPSVVGATLTIEARSGERVSFALPPSVSSTPRRACWRRAS